jgi:hypothetical protein
MQEAEAATVASNTSSTEYTFDYELSKDGAKMVPYIQMETHHFATGEVVYEKLSFPEFAYPLPKNVSLSWSDDHFMHTAIVDNYSFTEINGSTKAYFVDFVIEAKNQSKTVIGNQTWISYAKDYPSDGKERLFEFDLKTKKMKLLKSITTPKSYPYSRIKVYDHFKGYVIQSAADKMNLAVKDVEIYSLVTNKLVLKVAGDVYGPFMGDGNLRKYDRIPDNKSILIKDYIPANGKKIDESEGFGDTDDYGKKFFVRHYELFVDGRKAELKPNPDMQNFTWKKKIGEITYANYYDKKLDRWHIGYSKKGGAFIPYTSVKSGRVSSSWSPNFKYLVVMETGVNPATKAKTAEQPITIVDAATGKIIKKIEMLEPYYVEYGIDWQTDDFFKFSFYNTQFMLDRWMHVPSGVTTVIHNWHVSGEFNTRTWHFNGQMTSFLTPESPFKLYLNGKAMTYERQGAFQVKKPNDVHEWYVPLWETARFLGVGIKPDSKGWLLNRGAQQNYITIEKSIMFQNTAYVPLAEIVERLNMSATFVNDSNRSIRIITKELTEEEFLEATSIKSTSYNPIPVYDFKNGKWSLVPQNEVDKMNQYDWGGGTLIFRNGSLHSVSSSSNALRALIKFSTYNQEKHIANRYGAATKQTVGTYQFLSYTFKDSAMAFLMEKGKQQSLYFRMQ